MTADDLPRLPGFVLSPAARLLWRGPQSIHLELGDRAVVVDGLPTEVVADIASPGNGSRSVPPRLRPALDTLARSGYVWPRRPGEDLRVTPPAPRLMGQLTSLVPRHGSRAARVLAARRLAAVVVSGRSRLVPSIAAVLAGAGIGRVHCALSGIASLRHAAPGGVGPADEGVALAEAAEAAVRRAAPEVDTRPMPPDQYADLTVVASEGPIPEDRAAALQATGVPYLAVRLATDSGAVGPLVVPGLTSCLECADRHRRDRDPAWDALAAQLAIERRFGPAADAAVATIVAGVAAQQALAFLDGEAPATLDGTLELQLPDWRLRRRSWSMHPSCSCATDPA